MKAVILAADLGTHLSEETGLRPMPMVKIGGRPILWHILKTYSQHGISDFMIACGYKGYRIKQYFANYFLHRSDVTFLMRANRMKAHPSVAEPWQVTLVDTGDNAGTGGAACESTMFEREAMESLTAKKQVQAQLHTGFWQPMNTMRDKQRLEELWARGKAPWKTW